MSLIFLQNEEPQKLVGLKKHHSNTVMMSIQPYKLTLFETDTMA